MDDSQRLATAGCMIDEAMARLGHRELVSGQELVDLLLDLRLVMTYDGVTHVTQLGVDK